MKTKTISALLGTFALALAGNAAAQASPTELMVDFYGEEDFYLFDQTDVKLLDYKKERVVRVCADKRRHMVPLEVNYDNKTAKVRPGDCMRVEAKTVSVTPADDIKDSWDLSGSVQTF